MLFVIYMLSSVFLGIIPALIAFKLKKNFFLWWAYGAFFLPAALLHILLIALNKEQIINAVYIFIGIQASIIVYFTVWFSATQPIVKEQIVRIRAKQAIVKTFLEKSQEIIDKKPDIRKFISESSKVKEITVDKILKEQNFEDSAAADEKYLKDFSLKVVESMDNEEINAIKSKASYSIFSVPLGAAADVFNVQIDSLKLINKYFSTEKALYESNFNKIASTDIIYFHRYKNSEEFFSYLESEKQKAAAADRGKELIEYYAGLGDLYFKNKKIDLAYKSYDSAILIYRSILNFKDVTDQDKLGLLSHMAVIHDKKSDAAEINNDFSQYLDICFNINEKIVNNPLYKYESGKYIADLEGLTGLMSFINVNTVLYNPEKFSSIINMFVEKTKKFKTQKAYNVAVTESAVIRNVFTQLVQKDKDKFAKLLFDNFNDYLKPVLSAAAVEDMGKFFTENKYYDFAISVYRFNLNNNDISFKLRNIIYLANVQDKKGNVNEIKILFTEFCNLYFESDLFKNDLEDRNNNSLLNFIKLKSINNKESLNTTSENISEFVKIFLENAGKSEAKAGKISIIKSELILYQGIYFATFKDIRKTYADLIYAKYIEYAELAVVNPDEPESVNEFRNYSNDIINEFLSVAKFKKYGEELKSKFDAKLANSGVK